MVFLAVVFVLFLNSSNHLFCEVNIPKKIKNEPNWENMFEVTKSIVNSSNLPMGQREMVIDMLDYGKRLHITKEKLLNSKIVQLDKNPRYPKFD